MNLLLNFDELDYKVVADFAERIRDIPYNDIDMDYLTSVQRAQLNSAIHKAYEALDQLAGIMFQVN